MKRVAKVRADGQELDHEYRISKFAEIDLVEIALPDDERYGNDIEIMRVLGRQDV